MTIDAGIQAGFQATNQRLAALKSSKADKAGFVLSQSLPGFPVTDGLTLAFIPSLQAASLTGAGTASQKVLALTDAGTGFQLSSSARPNLTAPDLKYSTANGFWYLETNGTDQGLGLDDCPISSLVSADGHSSSIVCISTLKKAPQFNFGWIKKNGANNYDHQRRFGSHFPWSDGNIYFDYGAISNGRVAKAEPTGMSDDVTIRTIALTSSATAQSINVDNVNLVTGNPSASFSGGTSETGYLGFGHIISANGTVMDASKMRCFAFLFYNRAITSEEIGKINEWKNRKIGNAY